MVDAKQLRRCQITINNPDECGMSHDVIIMILTTKIKATVYFILCDEVGEQGTKHTHVFCVFKNGVRFTTIKKHFPTGHIEKTVGNIKDNVDYIRKQGKWKDTKKAETSIDGSIFEWGEKPADSQGKRSDIEALYGMIKEGLTNAEILDQNADYILHVEKLDKVRTIYLREQYKGKRRLDLVVTYIFGATGTGKSRGILDEYGDENVYRVTDYDHPFDLYECQDILVFEEFRSSMPLKEILNYLDIYPIQLKARYANKYACFTKIFIVTNWNLEMQYSDIQLKDNESYQAFLRRIHKVKHYKSQNEVVEYDSVDAYMNRNNSFIPITDLNIEEQLSIPFIKEEEKDEIIY